MVDLEDCCCAGFKEILLQINSIRIQKYKFYIDKSKSLR